MEIGLSGLCFLCDVLLIPKLFPGVKDVTEKCDRMSTTFKTEKKTAPISNKLILLQSCYTANAGKNFYSVFSHYLFFSLLCVKLASFW